MTNWTQKKSKLLRGDKCGGVTPPNPQADASIVRHILFLEGKGRETPYASTTEDEEIAKRFAGHDGCVYETKVDTIQKNDAKHISRRELLQLLKGKGKGRANWPSAYEVMRARSLVEEWSEHLVDFTGQKELGQPEVDELVGKIFSKGAK